MQIPDQFTIAWAGPASLFLTWWVLERMYSFTQSLDGLSIMNQAHFSPTYSNGTEWADAGNALRGFYEYFYKDDLRFYLIRCHVYLASIIGLIVVGNLWFGKELVKARVQTGKPHAFANVHKKLGWIMVCAAAINLLATGYTMFILGMIPSPPVVEYTDKAAWVVMIVSLPQGIYYAQRKNWKRHRSCMICFAGGLFVVPVQRFLWASGCKLWSAEDWNNADTGAFFGWLFDITWWALYATVFTVVAYATTDGLSDLNNVKIETAKKEN